MRNPICSTANISSSSDTYNLSSYPNPASRMLLRLTCRTFLHMHQNTLLPILIAPHAKGSSTCRRPHDGETKEPHP